MTSEISDLEFARFKGFIFDAAGITLADSKKALVSGRLLKRVRHLQCRSYGEYFDRLRRQADPGEVQIAVDLLTTNETFFFREIKHFQLLQQLALAASEQRRPLRVWSAACASGEEPYSVAMVLAECQPHLPWGLLASDISTRMLRLARRGHYPESRASQLPPALRQRYCLRGTGSQAGTLLVQKSLRERVQFMQINLDRPPPPGLGEFDLIFLRNVMIYFNADTKRQVVARVLAHLCRGGHLVVGHSETLSEISASLEPVAPAVYRKV